MAEQPADPAKLMEAESEAQAELIVAALADEGIEAQAEGGLIARFRVGPPARVNILVHRSDLSRARDILRNIKMI